MTFSGAFLDSSFWPSLEDYREVTVKLVTSGSDLLLVDTYCDHPLLQHRTGIHAGENVNLYRSTLTDGAVCPTALTG